MVNYNTIDHDMLTEMKVLKTSTLSNITIACVRM